jgi:cobalamin biosynthesis Mg chelatase CobN
MKLVTLIAVGLLGTSVAAVAEVDTVSDDPLLDARLEVVSLRLRLTEKNPKMIEAENRVDTLSRIFSENDDAYQAHVQERIVQIQAQEAELSDHYTKKHPTMIALDTKLGFLQQELQRLEKSGI